MSDRFKVTSKNSLTPADKAARTKVKKTHTEQRAEIERVAREHGADLSEEGFNEALKKVARPPSKV